MGSVSKLNDRRSESANDDTFHIEAPHEGHEEGWLVSYADLMTLLFGFFVIMYSISSVDKAKLEELKKMASKQFTNKEYVDPSASMSNDMEKTIKTMGLTFGDVEVTQAPDGVKLALRGRSFFPSGSSEISTVGQQFINRVASALLKDPNQFTEIRVEGHTDNVPIRTAKFPSNWELSTARASAVVQHFLSFNIPIEKLSAAGYAHARPLVPNIDSRGMPIPANQAKNRRIEVLIKLPQH